MDDVRNSPSHSLEERLSGDPTRSSKYDENGIALCCSGGGYKSASYQIGAYIRLNELGVLRDISRITSVSGGSITTAFLALCWKDLEWTGKVSTNFIDVFARPLALKLKTVSIDAGAIFKSLVPGLNGAKALEKAYRKHFFGDAGLATFPDPELGKTPDFMILATDYELNSLWRFSKRYSSNYRVGLTWRADLPVARIVAASSGFPPFFCPVKQSWAGFDFDTQYADRHNSPYKDRALLADAGIYDNLGLEPIWKRYGTLLVSNAGDPFGEVDAPRSWFPVLRRAMSMIHRQAENNRVRWLFSLDKRGDRKLVYWPLRAPEPPYSTPNPYFLSEAEAKSARNEAVRLKAMNPNAFLRLACHGYAMCDYAVRGKLPHYDGPNPEWPRL